MFGRKQPLAEYHRHDAYGSAAFAGLDYDDVGAATTGVHLGRLQTPSYEINHPRRGIWPARSETVPAALGPSVFSAPESNTLICAPAGAGKGTTIILPTLLQYSGSVFTIDPKGENTYVTFHRRQAMGQTLHVLNPWRLHDLPTAQVNPLDLLVGDSDPEAVSNATFLTDLLIIPSGEKDAFWDNSARALLRGLLLYTAAYLPTGQRTLGGLRRLLTQDAAAFRDTLDRMAASELFFGALREVGSQFRGMEDRTFSNVLSTAQAHTDFLTDPIVKQAMDRSDFSFTDLKRRPTTVYVILPAHALGTQARWLRLMVGMALTAIERGPIAPHRTLFLLDEFAALGHLQKVQTGVATLRGFGADLALVLQDLNQLRFHYPKGGDTILANCAFKHFMRISDKHTADYVSALLGSETILVERPPTDAGQGGDLSRIARSLRTPDELLRMDARTGVIVKTGSPPILTLQVPYFEDAALRGLASPHPMHACPTGASP